MYMSAEQKKKFLEAWNKHVESNQNKHKFSSFSSVAEDVFCESFKRGVMANEKLTDDEKQEIIEYMEAPPVQKEKAPLV